MNLGRLANLTRKTSLALVALSALAVPACMTLNVNVNLPESAVQKATDDYVRDLYRAKEKGRTPGTPSPSASPEAQPAEKASLFLASAWADVVFKVNSDGALKIREKLVANLDEVLAHKRAGYLGETYDGSLVLRNAENLKPLLKKKIEKTVQTENAARKELYEEVLRSNSLDSSKLKDIQKSFGRSFQAESPSGTWVQDGEGSWIQKP